MLEAASCRESAATLSAVVVSGMAGDSLVTIEHLEARISELEGERDRLQEIADDVALRLDERRTQIDELRETNRRLAEDRDAEKGALSLEGFSHGLSKEALFVMEAQRDRLAELLREAPEPQYGCACCTFKDGTKSKCWHCRVTAALAELEVQDD